MIKYYFDLMSQPSRALYIFLKITKTPVEYVKVDLKKAEHLTNEFKAINRFQKVPCIVTDDGFKLSESVAILRYIIETRNDIPDHWYPKDLKSRALVDEYLEYQHNAVRLPCAMYFQSKFLIPMLSGKPVNEQRVKSFQKQMESSLDALENIWLESSDKEFLASKEISFADILAACELEQPSMALYQDTFTGRPKLAKWYEKVKSLTNPFYDDAHKIVNKVIQMNKSKL